MSEAYAVPWGNLDAILYAQIAQLPKEPKPSRRQPLPVLPTLEEKACKGRGVMFVPSRTTDALPLRGVSAQEQAASDAGEVGSEQETASLHRLWNGVHSIQGSVLLHVTVPNGVQQSSVSSEKDSGQWITRYSLTD